MLKCSCLYQSLHAFSGVGFLLGSFVMRPFLPEEEGGHSSSEVCSDLVASNTSLAMNMDSLDTMVEGIEGNITMEYSGEQNLTNLVYPFSIAAGCHLLSASAFIIFGEAMYYL